MTTSNLYLLLYTCDGETACPVDVSDVTAAHAEYVSACDEGALLPGDCQLIATDHNYVCHIMVAETVGSSYWLRVDYWTLLAQGLAALKEQLAGPAFSNLDDLVLCCPHSCQYTAALVDFVHVKLDLIPVVLTGGTAAVPPVIPYPANCLHGRLSKDVTFSVGALLDESYALDYSEEYTRSSGNYHPSALSRDVCLRSLAYERMATPKNHVVHYESELDVFDLGHAAHTVVQNRLARIAKTKKLPFALEVDIRNDALGISGNADAVIGDWVIEIKTMSKDVFAALKSPDPDHVRQLHCYMFCLDKPQGQLLYVCRDNGKRREFLVFYDNAIMRQMLNKIASIEGALAVNALPPRSGAEYECRSCRFSHACNPSHGGRPS